jgi:ABC-type dipeptide/oligopeptide/nickel transport system ATPase component
MKICFIWVERFRNFDNFGINLSSSEKLRYEMGVLSRSPVNIIPYCLFGTSIVEVTGIVGKNGAGKSNALELICHAVKGGKNSIASDFLIVTNDNDKFTCHYSFSSGLKPVIPLDFEAHEYDPAFYPSKVIFFSNVFDQRRTIFHRDISDISLNKLAMSVPVTKRGITNFEKQIRLVNSKIFSNLEIDLPAKVQLLSRLWSTRSSFRIENSSSLHSSSAKQFRMNFRDRIRDINVVNKFVALFKFGFFFEFYVFYQKKQKSENRIFSFVKNLTALFNEIENIRSTEEIGDRLIEYLEENFSLSDLKSDRLSKIEEIEDGTIGATTFQAQVTFLKSLRRTVSSLDLEYHSEGQRAKSIEYFTFNYQSKGSRKFISDFTSLFGKMELFDLDWMGISSGHKAYINIFASLHQELRATRNEALLLCIDEGDLYLHPKWQVEFFDKLIQTLPNIFSGKVQLVLTSHSPFLLSDLPRQNISILAPERSGASMDGVELLSNTFGGNLYDLYAEPFFLGNKRTSDFAHRVIRSVIEQAESGELDQEKKNMLLSNISMFGDEIIQMRLRKILSK